MKRIPTILICLVLLALTTQAQTRIQSAIGNTGTSAVTTFNVTLGTAPINGNTLIAIISTQSTATNTITSITQTGATWTRAVSSTGNTTNGTTTEIWYTTALSGGATAITINQSSARAAAVIMEYKGLVYGSPLDVSASNFNTNTSSAASTGTTATSTAAEALWIGGIGLKSSTATLGTITNSFTAIANAASTNGTANLNARTYALERFVTTTGTASTGGTVSSRLYWSGAVAVFKSANLTSFSPLSACKGGGSVITINGTGFTAASVASFNGTSATTTFVNSGQITAILPALATPGFITVNTSGSVVESKKPFLVKSPEIPTANITNTTCPTSSDGAVAPNNIPIAVNFDYTKSQYINLGTPLLNNLSAFTLEGWIKTTTFNRNSFFGQNNAVEIGLTTGGLVELWSEGLYTNIYSPTAYPTDGLWHHIAGTGDGTTMKIYIDGELIASGTHAALPATIKYGSSPDNTMIGGYVWDAVTPNYHNGQVLKAGFWNRALTNTEIAALASTPHGYYTGETNLIAGYNFYEGNGTTLSKTPSGTNGTFAGTTVSTWTDLFTYSWTKASSSFTASTKNISGLSTGTYNLAATFLGCTANSGNFVVASNGTESTAATSISGTTPICNGSSSSLSINGGSLGTAASWKWYSASCGGTLVGTGSSIVVSPTTTTTYYVRAEGTCNTTACVSFTVTVNATGQWIGVTSTDWNTASNWCGSIPTSTTDVIIPNGVPYQPTIGDADGICNSLTINSGATVTISSSNTLTVHGNWINNGTFTANTSTVIFNGTTAISGTTINSFHHITINSTKSLTAPAANINITGNWTNNGTFSDNGGTVTFNGTVAQDITGVTTFNNLTVNNTAGVIGKSNQTVNGVLNLASANASATVGALDMSPVYSTDVLSSCNNLYMGANATTTGEGDVTGRVIRTIITKETSLSFGNALNTLEFFNNVQDSMPSQITFISRIGVWHTVKNNTVKRYYQIVKTGGGVNVKFNLKLHYLDSELDTITESRLVYWDHHVTYSGVSPHEHGKTVLDLTNNWLTLSGHAIGYLGREEYTGEQTYDAAHPENAGKQKIWMLSGKQLAAENMWIGAFDTNWDEPSNWTGGLPLSTQNVLIILPANGRSPIIDDGETKEVKSITINASASLTAGTSSVLNINGDLAANNGTASWSNQGTFVPGTSTVNFTGTNAAITGTTDFYNLTIASSKTLNMVSGSEINVSGAFTNSGTLNADFNGPTTFGYNGSSAQDVSDVDYYHLNLTGAGTKTLPAASMSVIGNLNLSSTITATSNTIVFDGSTGQTLTGSSTSALNNVTLNNTNGLTLSKNQTVNGVLTFTNGLITTSGSNALTLGCVASTSGEDDSKYVNGKLAREYCSIESKFFPIGKGGNYHPLTIARTTGATGSSTIQSEQFETTIAGTLPANITAFADRFWTISQLSGAETYTIQIDGTGFTPAGTVVIVKGDGTAPTTLTKLTATTPNYTTAVGVNTFGDFTLGSECLPPTIDTHPSATSSCELNGTPQFTVSASDSPNYQWQVSTTGIGGTFIDISNGGYYSNTTTATLTITNPTYSMNGYAYRVVVTRDCGGSSTSDEAVLTVNPQPQGNLSANEICKSEIGYLTWNATAGSGPFTVIYNAGAGDITVNNVVSGSPFSVGSHTASKTYTLVSVANASCTRTAGFTSGSTTVTVKPYITWTGATSTDWNTVTNWCGGIPTTNDDIIIPSAPVNQPVISTSENGNTKSLIVESGASVTVNGEFTLNTSGNITNNGTISLGIGTLTIGQSTIIQNTGLIETQNTSATPLPLVNTYGNSGTIRFNGSAAQTLFAGTYNDVVVDNPAGVVMQQAANVVANGKLEVKAGSVLEIGTGRSVTAKSVINNAGQGGIRIKSEADAPSGTLIFENAGETPIEATVEMHSKASWDLEQPTNYKYKWQFMGIPVQSLPALPTFYGGFVRRYNEGGNGYGYELTKRWIQLQNEDDMEYLSGYEIVQPTAKKYEFPGTLYNQNINMTLSYTVGADYPGQHLIGNPYTAAIDITAVQFGANMEETVYLYNTGTYNSWEGYNYGSNSTTTQDGTSYTAGQYTAVPKNTAGTGNIPGQIPAMQAFMVRTSGIGEGSIFVDYNAVKQKNSTLQRAKKSPLPWMRFNLIGATADQDVMWLFSKEGSTRDYDNGWDGRKLAGDVGTARIQAIEGNNTFQIDVVPDINNTIISARAGRNDTQYKLKIVNENMLSEYNSIYLLDSKTNTLVDISQNETEYLFTMTNTSSEPRFKILTSAGMTTGLANTNVNYSNGKLTCPNWDELSEVKVFDLRGVEVSNLKISDLKNNAMDIGLCQGVYILKITNRNKSQHCTKIIVE